MTNSFSSFIGSKTCSCEVSVMKKSPKSKTDSVVKEYVRRLSDEDLDLMIQKLTQPVCGDRADVSLMFQKDKELDKWLCQAKGAFEWFDKVDLIENQAIQEQERRFSSKEKKKKSS